MASWPTGIDAIKAMVASNNLQKVAPSLDAATGMLNAAAKHIDSAVLVAQVDPDGAYALLYDAARKSLAAVLQAHATRSSTTTSRRSSPTTYALTQPWSAPCTLWRHS